MGGGGGVGGVGGGAFHRHSCSGDPVSDVCVEVPKANEGKITQMENTHKISTRLFPFAFDATLAQVCNKL